MPGITGIQTQSTRGHPEGERALLSSILPQAQGLAQLLTRYAEPHYARPAAAPDIYQMLSKIRDKWGQMHDLLAPMANNSEEMKELVEKLAKGRDIFADRLKRAERRDEGRPDEASLEHIMTQGLTQLANLQDRLHEDRDTHHLKPTAHPEFHSILDKKLKALHDLKRDYPGNTKLQGIKLPDFYKRAQSIKEYNPSQLEELRKIAINPTLFTLPPQPHTALIRQPSPPLAQPFKPSFDPRQIEDLTPFIGQGRDFLSQTYNPDEGVGTPLEDVRTPPTPIIHSQQRAAPTPLPGRAASPSAAASAGAPTPIRMPVPPATPGSLRASAEAGTRARAPTPTGEPLDLHRLRESIPPRERVPGLAPLLNEAIGYHQANQGRFDPQYAAISHRAAAANDTPFSLPPELSAPNIQDYFNSLNTQFERQLTDEILPRVDATFARSGHGSLAHKLAKGRIARDMAEMFQRKRYEEAQRNFGLGLQARAQGEGEHHRAHEREHRTIQQLMDATRAHHLGHTSETGILHELGNTQQQQMNLNQQRAFQERQAATANALQANQGAAAIASAIPGQEQTLYYGAPPQYASVPSNTSQAAGAIAATIQALGGGAGQRKKGGAIKLKSPHLKAINAIAPYIRRPYTNLSLSRR